jgi:hypothetical protein
MCPYCLSSYKSIVLVIDGDVFSYVSSFCPQLCMYVIFKLFMFHILLCLCHCFELYGCLYLVETRVG